MSALATCPGCTPPSPSEAGIGSNLSCCHHLDCTCEYLLLQNSAHVLLGRALEVCCNKQKTLRRPDKLKAVTDHSPSKAFQTLQRPSRDWHTVADDLSCLAQRLRVASYVKSTSLAVERCVFQNLWPASGCIGAAQEGICWLLKYAWILTGK